jgi:DNA-binding MarR family transcriptional regulator
VQTVGGLAQRLVSAYATASGVVDALERKHLVRR